MSGSFKPTIKRFADLDGPDFFPTPRWATRALVDNENFEGDIWECACGNGAMSSALAMNGNDVESSDLYQRGFGEPGVDFLDNDRRACNIVTTPLTTAQKVLLRPAWKRPIESSRYFCVLPSLKAPIATARSSLAIHRAVFGCLVSELLSIPLEPRLRDLALRLTLGLFGTRMLPATLNLSGSNQDTRRVIHDPEASARMRGHLE